MKNKIKLVILSLMITTNVNGNEIEKKTEKEVIETKIEEKLIGSIIGTNLNFREKPSLNSSIIKKLNPIDNIEVVEKNNDWVKIINQDKEGYVHKNYIIIYTEKEYNNKNLIADNLTDFALGFVGNKYVYGGNNLNTGVDCSGYVQAIYKEYGVTLNRVSSDQYRQGTPVNKNELKKGDLLFFRYYNSKNISHTGIYLGDNKMVHASSARKSVVVSNINSQYYIDNYVGAKRVL